MVVHSHEFLRRVNGGEVSVVSLRDVARCIKLFGWFYTKLEDIRKASHPVPPPEEALQRALESMILALAHCYHFRLLEDVASGSRREYRETITELALACPLVRDTRPLLRIHGCGPVQQTLRLLLISYRDYHMSCFSESRQAPYFVPGSPHDMRIELRQAPHFVPGSPHDMRIELR